MKREGCAAISKLRIALATIAIATISLTGTTSAYAEPQDQVNQIQLLQYKGFADVDKDEWYVTSGFLDYVVDNNLLTGYSHEAFGPHDEIMRGQIAVILHRMAGEPVAESEDFDDVDYSLYYGEAIRWARSAHVVNGDTGTNNFGPERNVTRQEFAQMLANYAEHIGGVDVSSDCSGLNKINGYEEISEWARPAMGWAVDNGLISGVEHDDGTSWVDPHGATLRCQAAKMITVLHRDVLNANDDDPDIPEDPDGEHDTPGEYPDESYDGPTVVEFTDDVAGNIPDSALIQQDNGVVTITCNEDQYKVGDIVTLNPSETFPFGSAVRIEAEDKTNNLTIFKGSIAHPEEVYESLAINEHFDMDDLMKGAIDTQSDDTDKITHNVEVKLGEYGSIIGSVTVNDFNGHAIYIAPPVISILLGYTDIGFDADISTDLDFRLSALPSNIEEIKLGNPIPIPVFGAPGVGLNVQFYLNIDVSGHVVVSATASVQTDIHREFIGLHSVNSDVDVHLDDSVSIAVEGGIGPSAGIGLYMLLEDPIIEGGVRAGLGVAVEFTTHPNLVCGDAAIWVYLTGYASFFEDSLVEISSDFFDKNSSPLRAAIHVEDGEVVPKCTWNEETGTQNPPEISSQDPILTGVDRVELGRQYSAAYDIDGTLWMWGKNNNYQLGDGVGENVSIPEQILSDVKSISLGFEHTVAVDSEGTLWAWGSNNSGKCGIAPGDGTYRLTVPTKIMDGVKAAAAGDYTTLVLKEDDSLWTWGWNNAGQFGNGTINEGYQPTFEGPVKVMDWVSEFDISGASCAAIDMSGTLWTWGSNLEGQLGDGTFEDRLTPVKVLDNVLEVSVAYDHMAAIAEDGSLWVWGRNDHGQLGISNSDYELKPVRIMENVAQVSCGYLFTAAVDADQQLWTWGYNEYGQLGDGTKTSRAARKLIMDGAIDVSAGEDHLAVVNEDGEVYTCGENFYGQLGNGQKG